LQAIAVSQKRLDMNDSPGVIAAGQVTRPRLDDFQ